MTITALSPIFSVASQISTKDMPTIKAQGFRVIIANRPDDEGGADQPSSAELAAEAAKHGIHLAYVPFQMGQNPMEVLPEFQQALNSSPTPTLAFCKSGMRATILWALNEKGKQSADDILAAASKPGFDLSNLAPALS